MPLRMNDPRRAARCYLGDCLAVLPTLPAGSVDAVVTDPPAGIEFMGKAWDNPATWADAWGSPGAEHPGARHRLQSGAAVHSNPTCETCHREKYLSAARKAAGKRPCECECPDFRHHPERQAAAEARHRLSRREAFVAFLAGVMKECLRVLKPGGYALVWAIPRTSHWTGTAIEDAGFECRDIIHHMFGQGFPKGKGCLKPACENWWLARKPGPRVLPLNIEESRVPVDMSEVVQRSGEVSLCPAHEGYRRPGRSMYTHKPKERGGPDNPAGRWPANVCLSCDCPEGDGHDPDCPVALLDAQAGERGGGYGVRGASTRIYDGGNGFTPATMEEVGYGDSGGPSRFFYCPKASKADRGADNGHPCVKSQALMRWLVGLVSFPGETVLDPFMGSGTTGVACLQTGRKFIGIELFPEYHAIAARRIGEAIATGILSKE